MLLDHFEAYEAAQVVRSAIDQALTAGQVGQDIDAENFLSTTALGDVIAGYVLAKVPHQKCEDPPALHGAEA